MVSEIRKEGRSGGSLHGWAFACKGILGGRVDHKIGSVSAMVFTGLEREPLIVLGCWCVVQAELP